MAPGCKSFLVEKDVGQGGVRLSPLRVGPPASPAALAAPAKAGGGLLRLSPSSLTASTFLTTSTPEVPGHHGGKKLKPHRGIPVGSPSPDQVLDLQMKCLQVNQASGRPLSQLAESGSTMKGGLFGAAGGGGDLP